MNPLLGCAFLDTWSLLDGPGFAAIDGGDAVKFSHVDDLVDHFPGVTWVTSVPGAQFTAGQGGRKLHLRSGNFFPTPLDQIAFEIGVKVTEPWTAAKYLSAVIARSVRVASRYCRISAADPYQASFADSLQTFVAPNLTRDSNIPEVGNALRQSMAPPSLAGAAITRDKVALRIPMQRAAHVREVLAAPVPDGHWTEMNLSSVTSPIEWVENSTRPVLALVSFSRPKKQFASLLNKNGTKGKEIWMAHPELKMLREISEVKISRVYVSEAYVSAEVTLATPTPRFEPVDYAAMSSGLFAESFLAAACSVPPPIESNGLLRLMCSPRSAWLLSAARAKVLRTAFGFCNEGFSVLSFNAHAITVAASKNEMRALREYIRKEPSLLLPASLSDRDRSR